jgi:hypothetical protein
VCWEEVPDEEMLAEWNSEALDGEIPVILEETGEVTSKEGVKYPELVMEFSRLYFPDKYSAEQAREKVRLHGIRKPEVPSTREDKPAVLPVEIKDRLNQIFREATLAHVAEVEQQKVKYSEADIPRLRDRLMEISVDIMSGVPERMPPLRAVNHRIPLIDEGMLYHYHLPRCPDAMKPQLSEKI